MSQSEREILAPIQGHGIHSLEEEFSREWTRQPEGVFVCSESEESLTRYGEIEIEESGGCIKKDSIQFSFKLLY